MCHCEQTPRRRKASLALQSKVTQLQSLEQNMRLITPLAAAITALALLTTAGCAVSRDQQTTGAYIDDGTITTQIKSRMLNDPAVAGTSISIETLNGTALLSGFAQSDSEKAAAERIARDVNGVKSVKNEVVVRP
jgi:osmotically-inducible protein OsmY